MSNEYKPTYVDNTDNSISIMESTDTISFCKTGTKINTLSAKNVAHKKTGEDLNLCAFNNSNFNPVITINNNHSDCRIMTNLNVNGNVNINNNLIIPTHSATSTLLANVKGSIYYNTSENMYEGYSQTEGWQPLGGFSKTKDATIHKNLNVNGNINLTNEGMIKTTGIGSFGSISCGVGTFTTTDINGGTIDNVTIANSTWNGTVDRAAAADKVKISSVPSSNEGYYLSMVDPSTSTGTDLFTHGSLHYNPITNTLVATNFSGQATRSSATDSVRLYGTDNSGSDYYIPIVSATSTTSANMYTDSTFTYNQSNHRLKIGHFYTTDGFSSTGSYLGVCERDPKYPLDARSYDFGGRGTTLWNAGSATDGAWISIEVPPGFTGTHAESQTATANFYSSDLDPGTGGTTGIDTPYITAHFQYSIYTSNGGILFSSDERIKCNIKNIDDKLALEIIRKIETKTYNYYDIVGRGRDLTVGFIAQNVREHFPIAVKLVTRCIPNILKKINVSWQSFTENNETKYKMSTTDLTNIIGIKYKFYVDNNSDGRNEKEIEVIGNDDNTFTFDEKWNYVFCYGTEVDDFHSLDKDKIFTLHHSGIQELDRQQIADKERITNLETKINTLETENQQQQTKIDTLETENTELKSIIDKLKTANSFEEFKNSL